MLRSVGCTSYAPENAAVFDDDTAFQAALKALRPGDPGVFGAQLAAWGASARTGCGRCVEIARRAGGHLDPDLAARFIRHSDAILAALDATDLLAAVVAAEPGTAATVGPQGLADLSEALAVVVDLKGRVLLGHSDHVARLADGTACLSSIDDGARPDLRAAALLHDLGRTGVSSAVWDRP